jgi:hypothetical protein
MRVPSGRPHSHAAPKNLRPFDLACFVFVSLCGLVLGIKVTDLIDVLNSV